jgi:NAD(P)-dependent dehydrogenase (short-subunit alcohol dehydrogenase family)
MDLAGKVVVVTGAASGIGAAMARRLGELGAKVVVADVDENNGSLVAKQVGDNARFVKLDVTSPDSWKQALDQVVAEFGGLDILHCNAGVLTRPANAPEPHDYFLPWMTLDLYRKVMGINVDGVVLGTMAAVPHLQARGGGKIIITSSPGGLGGWAADPFYSMSKSAVNNWTMGAAPMLQEQNITINAAMPGGVVNTNMLLPQWKEHEDLKDVTALEPETIAAGIIELMQRDEGTGIVYIVLPDSTLAPVLPQPRPDAEVRK